MESPPFVVLVDGPMTECIRIQFVLLPSLFHANPTAFRFHCRYDRALCVPFAKWHEACHNICLGVGMWGKLTCITCSTVVTRVAESCRVSYFCFCFANDVCQQHAPILGRADRSAKQKIQDHDVASVCLMWSLPIQPVLQIKKKLWQSCLPKSGSTFYAWLKPQPHKKFKHSVTKT